MIGSRFKLRWQAACETCDGVRHRHQIVGVERHTAIRLATLTPAKFLGVDRTLGSLTLGKRADLVLSDEQLEACRVWLNGDASPTQKNR